MGSTGWVQLVGLDGGEMGSAKQIRLDKLGSIAARWWQDRMGSTGWARQVGLDGMGLTGWVGWRQDGISEMRWVRWDGLDKLGGMGWAQRIGLGMF